LLVTIDTGIEEFGSESGSDPIVGNLIPMGAVLAKALPVHWDEAVALLQELLDKVTMARREDIPGFDDVFIDANGIVSIHGSRRGEQGPVAAGRALHELLSTADVPVALRLFVTQANVPDTHPSLRAFADGLAYFGKSGRTELIRSIYARYRSTHGSAPVATPPQPQRTLTPPPIPLAPKANFITPAPPPKRTMPRWVLAVAGAAVAVSALVAVWLTAGVEGSPPPAEAEEAAALAAPKATTNGAASTNGAPSARSNESGSGKPQDGLQSRDLAARLSASASRGKAEANARVPAIVAYETLRAPSAFDSESSGIGTHERVGSAKAIYSRDDADVQPPVMLYPQMPPPLVVGGPDEAIVNRMELVISTDGSVERVRLVSEPRRMADMMLLSGAKLWRFAPAVKDGVPVRYRTTLSWTVFP
jgi:hypothetical protein